MLEILHRIAFPRKTLNFSSRDFSFGDKKAALNAINFEAGQKTDHFSFLAFEG